MHDDTLSRRGVLEQLAALSALALVDPASLALAQALQRQPTPDQTSGPFYPLMKPLDQDSDLTIVKGRRGRAEGQIIHLMGRVVNQKGEPVRGAKLELWQANTHGRYAHPNDVNPAPLDPNFQGFAVELTDAQGRFRFKTIKPGPYPVNPLNPDAIRPPHIHFNIAGKLDHLVTQMYFPGEPLNQQDEIFNEIETNKEAVIARVLPPTKEFEPGSLLVMWDVVLERG